MTVQKTDLIILVQQNTCCHIIALLLLILALQHQYRFIHDAVLEQLVCGDTQIRTPDFRRALEKLKQQELKDGVFKTGFAVQFDVNIHVSILYKLVCMYMYTCMWTCT